MASSLSTSVGKKLGKERQEAGVGWKSTLDFPDPLRAGRLCECNPDPHMRVGAHDAVLTGAEVRNEGMTMPGPRR